MTARCDEGMDRAPSGPVTRRAVPRLDYNPSFQRAIELIGRRWTGAVIRALMPGEARFNHLLTGIPGISDRVLTERLRELEYHRLVERLVDPGPPIRATYRLTDRAQALQPVIASVDTWVREAAG